MITATARDSAGIAVEVGPGGGLRAITLTDKSMRLGNDRLASTILDLVRGATAQANQRARYAMPDALRGLSEAELDALGIGQEAELAEAIEMTTPDTWMR